MNWLCLYGVADCAIVDRRGRRCIIEGEREEEGERESRVREDVITWCVVRREVYRYGCLTG